MCADGWDVQIRDVDEAVVAFLEDRCKGTS